MLRKFLPVFDAIHDLFSSLCPSSILRSGVFRFLIGDDAQPFTVPRGLFKDVSDPLHSMINNEQLKESIEGQAIITDCEGEVFAALCQYCLTGAYDVPHVAISDLEDPEHWEEQGFTAKGNQCLNLKFGGVLILHRSGSRGSTDSHG